MTQYQTEREQFNEMLHALKMNLTEFEKLIGGKPNSLSTTISRERTRNDKMPRFLMQIVTVWRYSQNQQAKSKPNEPTA